MRPLGARPPEGTLSGNGLPERFVLNLSRSICFQSGSHPDREGFDPAVFRARIESANEGRFPSSPVMKRSLPLFPLGP
jgi:hypothetical protein